MFWEHYPELIAHAVSSSADECAAAVDCIVNEHRHAVMTGLPRESRAVAALHGKDHDPCGAKAPPPCAVVGVGPAPQRVFLAAAADAGSHLDQLAPFHVVIDASAAGSVAHALARTTPASSSKPECIGRSAHGWRRPCHVIAVPVKPGKGAQRRGYWEDVVLPAALRAFACGRGNVPSVPADREPGAARNDGCACAQPACLVVADAATGAACGIATALLAAFSPAPDARARTSLAATGSKSGGQPPTPHVTKDKLRTAYAVHVQGEATAKLGAVPRRLFQALNHFFCGPAGQPSRKWERCWEAVHTNTARMANILY